MRKPEDIATKLLGTSFDALDARAQKVARHMAQRQHIARNTAKDFDAPASFGERDAGLGRPECGAAEPPGQYLRPLPFILLNLFLSMLAAIQAPVILMSVGAD